METAHSLIRMKPTKQTELSKAPLFTTPVIGTYSEKALTMNKK